MASQRGKNFNFIVSPNKLVPSDYNFGSNYS